MTDTVQAEAQTASRCQCVNCKCTDWVCCGCRAASREPMRPFSWSLHAVSRPPTIYMSGAASQRRPLAGRLLGQSTIRSLRAGGAVFRWLGRDALEQQVKASQSHMRPMAQS